MKVKTLICNCRGLSESFQEMDVNTLPFEIESELDVNYALVHPQLCGQTGQEILEEVLRSVSQDPDTYVVVGGCAPEAQIRLFKKLFRKLGFDESHLLPVDIRGATNEGIVERIRQALEALTDPGEKPH